MNGWPVILFFSLPEPYNDPMVFSFLLEDFIYQTNIYR